MFKRGEKNYFLCLVISLGLFGELPASEKDNLIALISKRQMTILFRNVISKGFLAVAELS